MSNTQTPSISASASLPLAVALFLTALSPGSSAQNREVELEWLRNAGTRLEGVAAVDRSGRTVSAAGDVNNDGIDDVLVATFKEGDVFSPAGTVYLIYGQQHTPPQQLGLGAADVILTIPCSDFGNICGSELGESLAAAGDVNDDGFDDFLIGAEHNGTFDAGRVYLVYGGPSLPANINLGNLAVGNAGVIIDGAANGDLAGSAVAGVGDVNADGIDDFLIGALGATANGNAVAGQAFLVYGSTSFAGSFSLAALTSITGVVFDGVAANDQCGLALAGAGMFNGDSLPDFIIGARDADPNGAQSGQAYVVFGSTSFPAGVDLASLGSGGLTLDGDGAGDAFGGAVDGGGDVNSDGFDDVIVGAHLYDDTASNEGRAYIIYGSNSPPTVLDMNTLGSAGVTLTGVDAEDEAGFAVAMGGDMNRNYHDDVFVSSRQADPNGSQSGEVYVLHGADNLPSSLSLDAISWRGLQLNGRAAGDVAGDALAYVGDFNNDNFADFAIGAQFADAGGNSNSGETYVFQGACQVLHANGPSGENETFQLTCHGPPNHLTLLFYGLDLFPSPIETGNGPFWMAQPRFIFGLINTDANGEWSFPVTYFPGLAGFTIYFQVFEQSIFPNNNITQLLCTTVTP
jgi:hypothetical protein